MRKTGASLNFKIEILFLNISPGLSKNCHSTSQQDWLNLLLRMSLAVQDSFGTV
jgi:hypothetical protein